MFWGLIMEPNKRYTQTVEKAFHLSMASLDASTATNALVQVMLCYDNRNYLLCTLQKDSIWQVPLDLNFQEGTKIAFTCNGEGHVHLTGYLIPEDEDLDDFDEEEMEEEIPELVEINKKRKSDNSLKSQNETKKVKKSKMEVDEDDDDESGDSDEDDVNGTLGMGDDSDDDDDDDNDEEDEDGGEESDDDEDDEEDEEEEDEEEVEVSVQPSKKQKQKQNQQNQSQQNQSQQNQSKKEKKSLVNGKGSKTEKEKKTLVNGRGSKTEKEQGKQKTNKDDSKTEQKEQQQPKKRKIEGGVQVEDLKQGSGAPAKSGKFISVYYTGRLKNGKKFDQTTQGQGFKFRLGKGEVIKGWDVGITGMKVGGKRKIVIPPNMAYGSKGSPPVIPPNSELTFEVELKAVH